MILGVVIGQYAPQVKDVLDTAKFYGVSARTLLHLLFNKMLGLLVLTRTAIAIGLIVMMWPVLTKVEYERIPALFRSRHLWLHIGLSIVLNWIIGPFVMLGLAWATLPDLPHYRIGVIMIGIARCIAMVMIWNDLAKGDTNYCAILVVVNAILQMVLYSPFALLFINSIGHEGQADLHVGYGKTAISVLIVSASLSRCTKE
jgi:ACR3 family arsenite transporter